MGPMYIETPNIILNWLAYVWFRGLFNSKAIIMKEQQWYYLTHSRGNKGGINTFPNIISLKMNIIVRFEFELTYFEAAV